MKRDIWHPFVLVAAFMAVLVMLAFAPLAFADLKPVLKPCQLTLCRPDIKWVCLCVSPREHGGGTLVREV